MVKVYFQWQLSLKDEQIFVGYVLECVLNSFISVETSIFRDSTVFNWKNSKKGVFMDGLMVENQIN